MSQATTFIYAFKDVDKGSLDFYAYLAVQNTTTDQSQGCSEADDYVKKGLSDWFQKDHEKMLDSFRTAVEIASFVDHYKKDDKSSFMDRAVIFERIAEAAEDSSGIKHEHYDNVEDLKRIVEAKNLSSYEFPPEGWMKGLVSEDTFQIHDKSMTDHINAGSQVKILFSRAKSANDVQLAMRVSSNCCGIPEHAVIGAYLAEISGTSSVDIGSRS